MKRTLYLTFLVIILSCSLIEACSKSEKNDKGWKVYALEYGHSKRFKQSVLIRGGDRKKRVPLSWMSWLILGKDRNILVDTGFLSRETADKWSFDRFLPVPKILGELKLEKEDITDVVITHLHWDHAGNMTPYETADFWVQEEELEWAKTKLKGDRITSAAGIRQKDLDILARIDARGRLKKINGDREIAPGIFLRLGGKHTYATQWVEIKTGTDVGTIVLASDNAYLYENIEKKVPIGGCRDHLANKAAIIEMLEAASKTRLVVPGHDPLVSQRFGRVGPHCFEIK
ncbi:MAG: N-acyl homoserine lactonase family protein [Proteobacteria bacterium]|nr:N-acyl homoserine lactonase family protein [Pseudomonadota bacterium]